MSKIAIVVDSTSCITHEVAKSYGNMFMIPLYFIFGEESYEDGVDLTVKEFFEKSEQLFVEKNILPTTSQPSIGRSGEVFEEILKTYDEIIYIPISQKISGTYQSGVLAAQEFEGKVHVLDTLTTSAGLKVAAITASNMVKNGASVEEVVETLESIRKDTTVYFVVSDLKHLQRTGRIGPAAMALGNALQLKPILKFVDGEIINHEKVRNLAKAHKKLVSYILELDLNSNDMVQFINAEASAEIEAVVEEVKKVCPDLNYEINELSPVISVNTGPGIIGAFVFKDFNLKVK